MTARFNPRAVSFALDMSANGVVRTLGCEGIPVVGVDLKEDAPAKDKVIFDAGLEAMVRSIILRLDSNVVEVYAYLSDNHEPLAWLGSRKLRQHPDNFGVSTSSESVHDQEALEIALNFYRRIGYQGISSLRKTSETRGTK